MSGIRAGADVVMTSVAVETLVSAAEDGVGCAWILGRVENDGSGRYYVMDGRGDFRIGMSAVCEEGGTDPDDGILGMFGESFRDGVLMVVDPYAGEFALYVSENGDVRKAVAVMSE